MATFEPLAASSAAGKSRNGGHTTISSRVCPDTSGKKSRKKSRVWSGFLYIFQLAAITFVLISEPFQFGMMEWCSNDAVLRRRIRTPAGWKDQRARSGRASRFSRTREPRSWQKSQSARRRRPDTHTHPSRSLERQGKRERARRPTAPTPGDNRPTSRPRPAHHRDRLDRPCG